MEAASEKLMEAIRNNDFDLVASILEEEKIAILPEHVLQACQYKTYWFNDEEIGKSSLKIVKLLVEHGADVHIKGTVSPEEGVEGTWIATSLMHAVDWNFELSRYLLEQGVDVNAVDAEGRNAFCFLDWCDNDADFCYPMADLLFEYGVDAGYGDQIEQILEWGEPADDIFRWVNYMHSKNVNVCNRGGVLIAAMNIYGSPTFGTPEHFAFIRQLVEGGADVNECQWGDSSLTVALRKNNLEYCEYLLAHGADINATTIKSDVAAYLHGPGGNPLHVAILSYVKSPSEAGISTIKWLISKGVDINSRDNPYSMDAIQDAAYHGNVEIFEYLQTVKTYSRDEIANCYHLFGMRAIFGGNDKLAFDMWKRAIDIRNKGSSLLHCGKLNGECTTVNELKHAIKTRSLLIIQLVLKALRIFDPDMKERRDTWVKIKRLVNEDVGTFTQVLGCILFSPNVDIVKAKAFFKDWFDLPRDLSFEDMFSILVHLVFFIATEPLRYEEVIFDITVLLAKILSTVLTGPFSEEEKDKVKCVLSDVVPRTYILSIYFVEASCQMSKEVVEFILECGYSIDEKDKYGNSPLHFLLNRGDVTGCVDIVKLLLDHEAHIDIRNDEGVLVHELLAQKLPDVHLDVFGKTSLRCLAARAIVDAKIDYERFLPTTIHSFVAMH